MMAARTYIVQSITLDNFFFFFLPYRSSIQYSILVLRLTHLTPGDNNCSEVTIFVRSLSGREIDKVKAISAANAFEGEGLFRIVPYVTSYKSRHYIEERDGGVIS